MNKVRFLIFFPSNSQANIKRLVLKTAGMICTGLFFQILVLSHSLLASEDQDEQNCPRIHLADKGGVLENYPVRSQVYGTCYANAGELLKYGYLKKQGIEPSIQSPELQAARYEQNRSGDKNGLVDLEQLLEQGGSSAEYLKFQKKNPPCNTQRICDGTSLSDFEKNVICGAGHDRELPQSCPLNQNQAIGSILDETKKNAFAAVFSPVQSQASYSEQLVCLKSTLKHLSHSCPTEPVPQFPDPVVSEIKSEGDLMKVAFENLAKNGIPFNLGIDGEMLLKGKDYQPQFKTNSSGQKVQFKGNTGHEVSVIGMEFNSKTKACELILRNSWGTSCNSYPWPCKDGTVSVDIATLTKNTLIATSLPKQKINPRGSLQK